MKEVIAIIAPAVMQIALAAFSISELLHSIRMDRLVREMKEHAKDLDDTASLQEMIGETFLMVLRSIYMIEAASARRVAVVAMGICFLIGATAY